MRLFPIAIMIALLALACGSSTTQTETEEPTPEPPAEPQPEPVVEPTPDATKTAPEEDVEALVRSFLAHAKSGDHEALKATIVMPLWLDSDVLEESNRSEWEPEWNEFLGHIAAATPTAFKVFSIPEPSGWGEAAKQNYAHFTTRPAETLRGVDVTFAEGGRGLGFICDETADVGWKIIGIDDNTIEDRFAQ